MAATHERLENALEDLTVLEVFEAIEHWAIGASVDDVDHFWSIVTGLRGPDNNSQKLKRTFTTVIRGLVLPYTAGVAGAQYNEPEAARTVSLRDLKDRADKGIDDMDMGWELEPDLVEPGDESQRHYLRHMRSAVNAIMLQQEWTIESAHAEAFEEDEQRRHEKERGAGR